ncbi:MAG: hypothetical protein K9M12_00300 [Candidatus Pacebacteria bacterium]|nr:hypothetical protein [Candidatus Paceibacterota bacterium]
MIKKQFKNILSSFKETKTLLFASVFALSAPLLVNANFVYEGMVSFFVTIAKIPYYLTIYPAIWMTDLLSFVTSSDFITFSYTGGDNPAIAAGLPITQGISNIILILVLLIVIVGIILELNEYGSKKMFVKLLIVALLINFAPLLVGLIVDASNVLMNYFIAGIGDEISAIKSTIAGDGGKLILEELDAEGKAGGITEDMLVPVALLLMQAFINVIMIFVLFLYALLYICRYIAIWIIVILSPIAFVCMIHTTTQKLWKDWFKQLMQWSLVGATGAFFLYLSLKVNSEIRAAYDTVGIPVEGESFISDTFSAILPLGMVAIFAVMGYILAIKTSAIGTDKIINVGQSTRRRAVKWGAVGGYVAGKYGAKKAKEGAQWGGNKIAGDRAKGWSTKENWGEGESGFKGWAKRTAGKPITGTARATGRFFGPGAEEQQQNKEQEKINKEKEKWKGRSTDIKASNIMGEGNKRDMGAVVSAAIEDGDFEDLMKTPAGKKIQENYANIYKTMSKGGSDKAIKEALPVEYLNMKKAEGISESELEKETMNIARNGDALKGSAKQIEKRIEEGDEMAMKLGRNILQQKTNTIQSFVDNAEKGMKAFEQVATQYYNKNEGSLKNAYKISSDGDKINAAIYTLNPSFVKHIDKSPGQIITDIKTPELKQSSGGSPIVDQYGNPL